MSFTIVFDTKGIRPVVMCLACTAESHELCDGKDDTRRYRFWQRRLWCGCAAAGHDWR